MMGSWMFGGWWMIIVWLVVIGLVVWGVVTLTRRRGPESGSGEKRSAMDIARERYAKGEISKEEFERIKKDLS